MRVPINACCAGSPDREMSPVSAGALLAIASIYAAIGFFAFAVAFFHL